MERRVSVKRTSEEKTELGIKIAVYVFQILCVIVTTAGILVVSNSNSYIENIKQSMRDSSVVTARVVEVYDVGNSYVKVNIEYDFLNVKYTSEITVESKSILRNNTLPVYVSSNKPDKPFVNNTNTWETLKIAGYTIAICGVVLFFILLKASLYVHKIYKRSSLDDRIELYKKEGYIDIDQMK